MVSNKVEKGNDIIPKSRSTFVSGCFPRIPFRARRFVQEEEKESLSCVPTKKTRSHLRIVEEDSFI